MFQNQIWGCCVFNSDHCLDCWFAHWTTCNWRPEQLAFWTDGFCWYFLCQMTSTQLAYLVRILNWQQVQTFPALCWFRMPGRVVLLQAGSCQMALMPVVWLLSFHMWALFGHWCDGDSDANNLAQVSCPWAGVFWRSTFNMAKEWQIMMVTFIMSKMLKMNDVQRADFSEELENLREVIRSVLTVCGERLVSLSDLWTLLTACRCLQDQVNLAKIIPSEGQIKVVLDGNPSTGAAPAASLGTFDELRLCPYRTVLNADMMAAIQCAQSLCKLEAQSDEFQQALFFLQDTHAFLRILSQLEKKSGDGCSDSETPWMIRLVAWMSVGSVPDVAYFYHGKKKRCCILLSSCGTSFARLTFPCPLLSYHDCLQLPSSKI